MKTCLVVGCASGVWDEVKAAQALCKFDAVYCVKQAGIHWPGWFDVWATLHPEFMDAYEAERRALHWPAGYEIVAPVKGELGAHGSRGNVNRRVSYRWPGMNSSASSGIYAAKIALEDGFGRVVLTGIPMTVAAGHFLPKTRNVRDEVRGHAWNHRDSFMPGFQLAIPHLRGKVKSMSGHTREVLGEPTPEWLEGTTQ